MRIHFFAAFLYTSLLAAAFAQSPTHLLLRPSATHIVFEYASDLWIVPRAGGEARRLTSGVGVEFNPRFSPDGSLIAFSGEYDGNVDVYVVPVRERSTQNLQASLYPDYHPELSDPWCSGTKASVRNTNLFRLASRAASSNEPYPMPTCSDNGPPASFTLRSMIVPTRKSAAGPVSLLPPSKDST